MLSLRPKFTALSKKSVMFMFATIVATFASFADEYLQADEDYRPVTIEEKVLFILKQCQSLEPLPMIYLDQNSGRIRTTKFEVESRPISFSRSVSDPTITRTKPLQMRSMKMGSFGLANWSSQICIHKLVSKEFPQVSCYMQRTLKMREISIAEVPVQDFSARIELWVNNPKEFHSKNYCPEPL